MKLQKLTLIRGKVNEAWGGGAETGEVMNS